MDGSSNLPSSTRLSDLRKAHRLWVKRKFREGWDREVLKILVLEDLIDRLRKRAAIRRQISTRKSVQEGKPDRIADLLEEAANALDKESHD